MHATIHIDGAARGNPGPAAYAFVIAQSGHSDIEESGLLGEATNNVAEYTALVKALHRAAELGLQRLTILSDSELLVKQMNGQYKVNNETLRALFGEAKTIRDRFDLVTLRHVPREQNARADRLCNEALDGKKNRAAAPKPAPSRGQRHASREEAVAADAIECLRAAAVCWSKGDARYPPPEDVWSQLWSILEDHHALRPTPRHG